jgi:murein DD-endopeptidase MepM/ murein hydrolase activator NlpD
MTAVHARAPIALVALLLVLGLVAPELAASSDTRSQRERARQQRADVARQIDTLRSNDQELAAAVARLDGLIRSQQADVSAARQALAAAEEEVAETQRRLAATRERTVELRHILVERAVDAYIRPGGDDLDHLLDSSDFGEANRRQVLLQQVSANDQDLIDELRAAAEDLEVLEAENLAAAERARQRREATESRLSELQQSRAAQAQARAELDRRIADFRREADALSAEEGRLTRLIAEQERSRRGQVVSTGPVSASGLVWPVRGVVTSEYGQRWGRLHAGIDVSAPTGRPIVAAQTGRVIQSGWMGGYGNSVVIDHGGGFTTVYAHMSRIAASNGSSVSRGTVIGYVGSTGNSTGPHLHFETRVNGSPQNPRRYLP